ncbi:uncharacterized protein LOC135172817 [Diachasmimorpha longicaudata]|uniref:uncharacterized protein LOC135172817 n=1 Tax=Diachasmimorpha longicaudata TaxID=58733 RepID=UPI0030B8C550
MSKIIVTILVYVLMQSLQNDVEGTDDNGFWQLNETTAPVTLPIPKPIILLKNETRQNSTRKSRNFSGLSFWTGLGLGSIAGAAALDSTLNLPGNFNRISKLATTTEAPPNDLDLSFGSSEFLPLPNISPSSISNLNYAYIIAMRTNALLNKTLRSVQDAIKELKGQLDEKVREDEEQLSQSSEEVVQVDAANDDYVVVNRTTLQDIVKASIAEEIANSNEILLKQVSRQDPTRKPPGGDNVTDPAPPTTEVTTDMTTTPIPSSTWQDPSGWYYGGQSQNISGVDLTSVTYSPTIQTVYPPYPPLSEIYPASPPIYAPVAFQEHHPDYYESYPTYNGGFNGISDSHPYYSHFPNSRKFSLRDSKDLGGFVPVKKG